MNTGDVPEANYTVPRDLFSVCVLGNGNPTFLADAGSADLTRSTPGADAIASSDVSLNAEVLSASQSGPTDFLANSGGSSSPVWTATPAYAGASIDVQVSASALSPSPGADAIASSDVSLNAEVLSASQSGPTDFLANSGGSSSPVWTATPAYAGASIDVHVSASALSPSPGADAIASSDVSLDAEALSASQSGPTDFLADSGGSSSPVWTATPAYAGASIDVHVSASALSTSPGADAIAGSGVSLDAEALSASQSGPTDFLPASGGSSSPVWTATPAYAGASIDVQVSASALSPSPGADAIASSDVSLDAEALSASQSGPTDFLANSGGSSSPVWTATPAYAGASIDVHVSASALSTSPGADAIAGSGVSLDAEALSASQSGPTDFLPASGGSSSPVWTATPAYAGASIDVQVSASVLVPSFANA